MSDFSYVTLGDMRAQVACARLGARRPGALCSRYGAETILAARDWIFRHRRTGARKRRCGPRRCLHRGRLARQIWRQSGSAAEGWGDGHHRPHRLRRLGGWAGQLRKVPGGVRGTGRLQAAGLPGHLLQRRFIRAAECRGQGRQSPRCAGTGGVPVPLFLARHAHRPGVQGPCPGDAGLDRRRQRRRVRDRAFHR